MEYNKETVQNKNEIVFYDKTEEKYIKEVNHNNVPISFTKVLEEALTVPNTIKFKNSRKYESLLENGNVTPINKIETTTYTTRLEGF